MSTLYTQYINKIKISNMGMKTKHTTKSMRPQITGSTQNSETKYLNCINFRA